jgi:putative ABC transport system ATP-binding protein
MAIMQLLKRSCEELGQTIVIVTHDPRAASTASRVVFLRDGKIVEEIRFEKTADKAQRLRSIIDEMEKLEA